MDPIQQNQDQLFPDHRILDILSHLDKFDMVSLISKLPVPLAVFDIDAVFLGVNQLFADFYELDAMYLMGKRLNTFSTIIYSYFLEASERFQFDPYLKKIDQEFYLRGHFYLLDLKVLRNTEQKIHAIVAVCTDVTRLKRKERVLIQNNKKLHDLLYIDQMTGVQNRRALERFLNNHVVGQKREDYSFIKIDLEDFNKFNELNSYTFGDERLCAIAQLFSEELKKDRAELFRLNSASFVVVLENSTPWSALTVAERLKHKIIQEDIRFEEGAEDSLSVSIGIFHPHAQDENDQMNIFELIDLAVQQAKAQGKNAIVFLD